MEKVWSRNKFSSNGVLYPEEFYINQENLDYFNNLPDDTVIEVFEENEGPTLYRHVYRKSDINEITVIGKKTLKGTDEIGEFTRQEDGIYEYKEKQVYNRHIEEVSKALNIPIEQLSCDEVRPNIILHNGYPILPYRGWNSEHTHGMVCVEEKKGNAFEERIVARINNAYLYHNELYRIGDFVVSKFNDEYTLEGIYDSKEEKLEEFNRLLEYLGFDKESAPYRALGKQKMKVDLRFAPTYAKNKEIVSKLGKRDKVYRVDVAHEIIEMARNKSLSAKSILERNTLIQEKEQLENFMGRSQEDYVISEIKDAISDRKLSDVNKVVTKINESVQEIPKETEHTIDN